MGRLWSVYSVLLVLALLPNLVKADISVQHRFENSNELLTTEKIWNLDPGEENPNRALWVLEKKIKILGLNSRAIKAQFGVSAEGILSETKLYLRSVDAFLKPDLGCPSPDDARKAGQVSADEWGKLLIKNRLKLSYLLDRVRASTQEHALMRGMEIFSDWIQEIESSWRFTSQMTKSSKCKGSRVIFEDPLTVSQLVMLTRAPARKWDGLYTVRLSIEIGNKILNGQFLVDSSAPRSILSPTWLESQGINPSLIEVSGLAPRKVMWSGGVGLAKIGRVLNVSLSGVQIPIQDFLIFETERFLPPASMRTCCDGVLGGDFLRHFVVEFSSGPPVELKIFDRKGFSLGSSYPHIDVERDSSGLWTSDCNIENRTVRAKCGIDLLGRGTFTLDFPHGRIWFERESLDKKIFVNKSGLTLKYRFDVMRDRVLQVTEIKSQALLKAGLKVGSLISAIDAKPSVDMDQWEVDQRLSGAYGNSIVLEWRSGKGIVKVVPFTVR